MVTPDKMKLQAPSLAALPGVRHGFFTRQGGISSGVYASLNCGPGSGDDAANVAENRARVLVPLNHPGGVGLRLHGWGLAAGTLRLLWNGDEVARAPIADGQEIALTVELGRDQVDRGVNLVDLVHEGIPADTPAARYDVIDLWERP